MASTVTIEEEDFSFQQFVESAADISKTQNSDQTEILIGEIQAYPILWDKASPEYKESHQKRLVWAEISLKHGLTGKNRILHYISKIFLVL